jgi:hypothetical protein
MSMRGGRLVRLFVLVFALCAATARPAAAAPEVRTGSTACGRWRLELGSPSQTAQGTERSFAGTVCGDVAVDGTMVGDRYRMRLARIPGPRPLEIAGRPDGAGLPLAALAAQLAAIRQGDAAIARAGASWSDAIAKGPPSNASAVIAAARNLPIFGGATLDVGCTDLENLNPAIDPETAIVGKDYYVPPWCTVIVSGTIDARAVVVDGMLIRHLGDARAVEVVVGTQPVLGLQAVIVRGTLNTPVLRLNAGTSRAGSLVAPRIELGGGSITVDGRAEADLIVGRGGTLSATTVAVDRIETHGGGVVRAGGTLAAPVRVGVRAPGALVAVLRGGAIAGATVTLETATLEAGAALTASTRLTARSITAAGSSIEHGQAAVPTITLRDSTLKGSELTSDVVTAEGSRLTLGRATVTTLTLDRGTYNGGQLDVAEADAQGPVVDIGLLRARRGAGRWRQDGGSLEVGGKPPAPGFAACARHVPGGDLTRLELTGARFTADHLRAGTFLATRTEIAAFDPQVICFEVTGETAWVAARLKAFRVYASLGRATVDGSSQIVVDGGGDGPQTVPIRGWEKASAIVTERMAGPSFGGFGGTVAVAASTFEPALAVVDTPQRFRELGLGGMTIRATSMGTRAPGRGGGTIALRAEQLTWDGVASANGTHGDGGSGGTGGGITFAVRGALAGKGLVRSNGGNGVLGWWGETGAGGSGGRIRIDHGSRDGWTGRTETLGGVGGQGKPPNAGKYWADWRNHGGPGTVYWKPTGRPGTIVIENVSDATPDGARWRGIGSLAGDHRDDHVRIVGAVVVGASLRARSLTLERGAVYRPDAAVLRLEWPPGADDYPAVWKPKARSLVATAGGSLLLSPDAVAPRPQSLAITIGETVTIDATSRIDLSGLGGEPRRAMLYANTSSNVAGGSHGGIGGAGFSTAMITRADAVSGDPLAPTRPGGGGYGQQVYADPIGDLLGFGGAGGGVLRLQIGGALVVDGSIRADGAPAPPDYSQYETEGKGGGAGGSVWITARELRGTGLISASGGKGGVDTFFKQAGGGGGGGRIRIDGKRDGFTGKVRAFGGVAGQVQLPSGEATDFRNYGGTGTINLRAPGENVLLIDGRGPSLGISALSGSLPGVDVEIRVALVATTGLTVRALTLREGALLTALDSRMPLLWRSAPSVARLKSPLAEPPLPRRITLVAQQLTVDKDSLIAMSALGGMGRFDEQRSAGAYANPAGASHGGQGGYGRRGRDPGFIDPVTGSATAPVLAGPGGYGPAQAFTNTGDVWHDPCSAGGSGGAAIQIRAASVAVDGVILAEGGQGAMVGCASGAGGGAGGSIWIRTTTLTGSGRISADGGAGRDAGGFTGGGGGGGRIAIAAGQCRFTGTIRAAGGRGNPQGSPDADLDGKPGTISPDGLAARCASP